MLCYAAETICLCLIGISMSPHMCVYLFFICVVYMNILLFTY